MKNNIQEIKNVTDKMMELDEGARLNVDSKNEVGELKEQIKDLYFTLLDSIDDLEVKNKEILKLEKLKYDFFRGASHELKTPLASLKIILENMKYKIGKYKDRDLYIDNCIEFVDGLNQNISQILSISSLEHLKDDEETIKINDFLKDVLEKYKVMASQKNIAIENRVADEEIYIGRSALKIILSNLVSNAVKYTKEGGFINIGVVSGWFYIENNFESDFDIDRIFNVEFNSSKENSNGLGLYIVRNLLLNYNLNYDVSKTQENFIFKIELS